MTKHYHTGKGMFLKQPFHVLRHMTMDELVDLKKKQRAYAVEAGKPLTRLDGCALLHPLIYAGLRISHLMGGFKVAVSGKAPRTRRPVIYAASHIGLYDVEAITHAIRKHIYFLAADEAEMYGTFDGLLFALNGVIYVDPEDTA